MLSAQTVTEQTQSKSGQDLQTVNFRLTKEQRMELRNEAHRRAIERGHGKADASEIVRALLDEWIAMRRSQNQ